MKNCFVVLLLNPILLHKEHPVGVGDVRTPWQQLTLDKVRDEVLLQPHTHHEVDLRCDPGEDGRVTVFGKRGDEREPAKSYPSLLYLTF